MALSYIASSQLHCCNCDCVNTTELSISARGPLNVSLELKIIAFVCLLTRLPSKGEEQKKSFLSSHTFTCFFYFISCTCEKNLPCSNLLENLNFEMFSSPITTKRCWGSHLELHLIFTHHVRKPFCRQHRECRSTASGLWRTWCWGTNTPTKAWSHLCSTAFLATPTPGMRAQVRPLAVITSHRRAV